MTNLTFKNSPIKALGEFPLAGQMAADFKLVTTDLAELSLADFKGKK